MDKFNIDAYIDHVRATIDEYGLAIQAVGGGPDTPGFAYTVGLFPTLGFEVLTIAMPVEYAHSILNQLAVMLKEQPIENGVDINELATMPLRLRDVDALEASVHVGVASRIYDSTLHNGLIPIRQLIWPDPTGHFPNTPEYNYRISQDLSVLESRFVDAEVDHTPN
jgi:Domain of unknown function (DUF4262)